MGSEYAEVSQACRARKGCEELHISNSINRLGGVRAVFNLLKAFTGIREAILLKELRHIWSDCGEIDDPIVSNPCPDFRDGICRSGFKGNKFHKYSFLDGYASLFK